MRAVAVAIAMSLAAAADDRAYSSKCEVGRAVGIVQGRLFETFAIFEEHVEFAGTEVFELVRRE